MSYIGNEPIVSATRTITEVTATAGQTVFVANGGYTVGYIDVFLNGAQLQTVDFTATNGSSITLTEAAQAGDVIRLVAWGTFQSANHVAKTGDTMTGGLNTHNATNSVTFSGGSTEVFANAFRAATGDTNSRAVVFKGADATQGVSTWYAGGNNVAYGGIDASFSNGLTIWTNDGTSWVNGFKMNRSGANGSVDLPAQPIISGQIGTALTAPAAPQKLAFNQFWVNQGGISYNSSTRRFTVPVAGVYRITMNPFKASGVSAARVLIGINNDTPNTTTHYGHIYEAGNDYGAMCLDSVVTLSANDYIVFYLMDGTLYNNSSDLFNQFTIAKIA